MKTFKAVIKLHAKDLRTLERHQKVNLIPTATKAHEPKATLVD